VLTKFSFDTTQKIGGHKWMAMAFGRQADFVNKNKDLAGTLEPTI